MTEVILEEPRLHQICKKKYRILETENLSTNADSSTDTFFLFSPPPPKGLLGMITQLLGLFIESVSLSVILILQTFKTSLHLNRKR